MSKTMTQKNQPAVADALNALLADSFALYLKTKNYHWHVHGPHFRELHLLFDEQATQILATTEYTGFLWATLWGWVVFGERVSVFTVVGAALIVGGCILAARRRDHAPVADSEAQLP